MKLIKGFKEKEISYKFKEGDIVYLRGFSDQACFTIVDTSEEYEGDGLYSNFVVLLGTRHNGDAYLIGDIHSNALVLRESK